MPGKQSETTAASLSAWRSMIEPKVNYLDLEIMQKMCHPIAVALFDSTAEPMTQLGRHARPLLESALNNPRQTFDGHELYPTLTKKAAILYYSLIKNHPFENGNKRTATAALLVFLFINGFRLKRDGDSTEDYLVSLATRVAASQGSAGKDTFLDEIDSWLLDHLIATEA